MKELDEILKLIDFTAIEIKKLCSISNNRIARESKIFHEYILEAYQAQIDPSTLENSPFSSKKKIERKKKMSQFFFEDYDKNKVSIEKIRKNCYKIKKTHPNNEFGNNLRTNKILETKQNFFCCKVTTINKNSNPYSHFSGVQTVSEFSVHDPNNYNGKGVNFLNRSNSQLYGKSLSGLSTPINSMENGDSFLILVDLGNDLVSFEDKNGKFWKDTLSKFVDISNCCFFFSHYQSGSEFQVEFSNKKIV